MLSSNWTENRGKPERHGERGTNVLQLRQGPTAVIVLVRIIGRVSQWPQFPLHHRLRHHERMPPLRVDVLVDQGRQPRLSVLGRASRKKRAYKRLAKRAPVGRVRQYQDTLAESVRGSL